MRRHMTRSLAAATLAGATALSAIPPAAAHDLDTDRFRVTLRPVSEHYEDVGRRGLSVGDRVTFSENLYHRGNRVGRDDGTCEVTRRGPGRFAQQCVVTVTLRGRGTLTLQGLFAIRADSDRDIDLAVTGGTGKFADAGGTATLLTQQDGPSRLRFHLH